MDDRRTPMDPAEAERRYGAMLEEAGLPRFATTHHDPAIDMLEFTWEHGLTIHVDLTREMDAIDDWERDAILDIAPTEAEHAPVDVYVPGSADDPREDTSIPGIVIHRGPPLHPDDLTTVDG